ncbi:MAG: peptidyl-prolyl cis-trans isomerase, EpsD family [Glaciimonas sp.]|nr:peptidyl-prolyl cis-trans isomerase, EpsD family [Glaciimonas sp.]
MKKQVLFGALTLAAVMSLSACNKQASSELKDERSSPFVKVNDVEITMLQSIDDLGAAERRPIAAEQAVNKQLLETMIDRQLLQEEAMRNRLDRDPKVIQAIDHAKTQILAQAYLQSKFATIDTPSKAEIDAYFQTHPELFTQRKLFYMNELVVATKDVTAKLKMRLDSAKSIEQVAVWLDNNHVQYKRTQLTRSTADLAPEIITKLRAMRRNQLFVIKAGEYSMLNSIYDVKPSPVTAQAAAPQIERYLRNKKRKEIGDLELGRLRASAKIEYLNKKQLATTILPAVQKTGSSTTAQIENGITGVK